MFETISLPLWVVVLLVLFAGWAILDRLLVPSARFILRQRANRVVDELNRRLDIRIQPFKLTKRRVLIDRLTFDPEVVVAIDLEARQTETPRQVVVERVERYAREIVPSFNAYFYFRIGYRIARAVARTLYRVRLGTSNDEALATIDPNSTVVFVMNHRSNMDYVLVSYLAADRTALSYAVGEWARMWPLESLIKAMGAYFVRRNSKNDLYRKVLERYIAMATAEGVTQAVYPEGGLSRDGRLRPPKLGLIDYMLRSFDPDGSRDLVFVPVGINYDRVLEDRTLLLDTDEGRGGPRKRPLITTLRFLGRNLSLVLRSRWHRFGYACVDVGKPLSLRDFLRSERRGDQAGVDPRALDRSERFGLTQEVADELMSRVGRVIPIVPVALVSSVFVECFARSPEESLSTLEFKAHCFARLKQLEAYGAAVYLPRNNQDYAIEVGLRMLILRRLIESVDGRYKPVASEIHVLRYYAHSIDHHSLDAASSVA